MWYFFKIDISFMFKIFIYKVYPIINTFVIEFVSRTWYRFSELRFLQWDAQYYTISNKTSTVSYIREEKKCLYWCTLYYNIFNISFNLVLLQRATYCSKVLWLWHIYRSNIVLYYSKQYYRFGIVGLGQRRTDVTHFW